ncbi:MAG: radical SAM/SPASM domain-containing protein [Oscillospiraceae bacterium]|nr:radical SAM/SPASM domain-containing protein [Oscillospiraceae bacterium]
MSREVAFAAVKLGMENKSSSGLLFYGGEPLLEKQLIYDIVDHTKAIKKKTDHTFYYKMTTNGTLLDEEFLKFSRDVNLTIGFSHDGPMQDKCRLSPDGKGTFSLLEEKIPLLLKYQPYAVGMSVMDPSTVHSGAEIVKFLFDKGFRYIHLSLNYSKTAPWTKELLCVLEREYNKLAQMYLEWTKAEKKFYLSPFDMKILSHLKGEKYNTDRLRMAQNQPSVTPDGKIYYSSKYLGDPAFIIGDVFSGIDPEKQKNIYEKGAVPANPCQACAIRTRCNYAYDSLISQEGGIVTEVSPMQCANEQIITPIADYVAEKLYKERNALFMHKHYNELYPVMSLVEDRCATS